MTKFRLYNPKEMMVSGESRQKGSIKITHNDLM